MTNNIMTDSELRKSIIQKRKALSKEEIEYYSDQVFARLITLSEYKNAQNVLLYIDYNGEIKTDKIMNHSVNCGKKVFVPLCVDDHQLNFYRINSLSELKTGHYGILEPVASADKLFTDKDLENNTICIVPGTVFDINNNRMGYGMGYYDRYFDKYMIPDRIGLAYRFQIVNALNVKPTDVKMTKILFPEDGEKND